MNRRDVVKAMLTLPAATVLGGCSEKGENPQPTTPQQGTAAPSGAVLRIVLHGPFAVVIQTAKRNRVTAVVPFDAKKEHEFAFGTPNAKPYDSKQSFRFVLDDDGLEGEHNRAPYIDRGFDDFNFRLGEWDDDPDKHPDHYFVVLDLPAPDVISYIPPAEAVIFGGQPASMPIDHILEYRVADRRRLKLHCPQFPEREREKSPIPLSQLHEGYRSHWSGKDMRGADSQRGYMDEEFKRWSAYDISTFYFGVGLPEDRKLTDQYQKEHAKDFFNNRLRPLFPNARVLQAKTLDKIDGYGPPCTNLKYSSASPMVMPAVFQSDMQEPRFLEVSYTEDCRAGGLVGTTP